VFQVHTVTTPGLDVWFAWKFRIIVRPQGIIWLWMD
jgi:hypothetical protein